MANLLGTDYLPDYVPTQDEKTIALLTHLSFFLFPFIAPLVIFLIIGIPMMVVLGLYGTALTIVGIIRASEGRIYEYPFTIKLIN